MGIDNSSDPGPQAFAAADDDVHFDSLGDDWWATETAWFSFHVPERRLGGWLYTMLRPNIGTVAGGAWVWDDTAYLPWEVPYSANYTALELPRPLDFTDCRLPTGVSLRVIEPTMRYALGYEDGERLCVDLRFEGVMPPEPLTSGSSTFGKASHFDQLGRVSGTIVLHGESIPVDCIGMRDRTWGRRPEDRPRQAAYVTGAADADNGFLAVTGSRESADRITYGFLRAYGRTVPLAGGERQVDRDPATGWATAVRLRGEDREGRPLEAIGEPWSRIVINRHTFIDINSLVRWRLNDREAWGEDQDMWPVHRYARMRRTQRGGTP